MGGAKEMMMRAWERKLVPGAGEGQYVCAECFNDDVIETFVRDRASESECSFCDNVSEDGEPIAAPLEDVLELVSETIQRHYDDAANWLMYESAEGGYQGSTMDGGEVLDDLGMEGYLAEDRDHLKDTIAESLADVAWCKVDPYGMTEHERLRFSWDLFCSQVKHRRRYFFIEKEAKPGDDDEERDLVGPADMLRRIVSGCIRSGLVKPLPAGTKLYRAHREEKYRVFSSPRDYGAPPPERARQNRMSPAGISMTYLAEDVDTAVAETAVTEDDTFKVGQFKLLKEATVMDLTALPEIPSIFDADRETERQMAIFLRQFIRDLSKPIVHDGQGEHIEYVPTQVVTEYFRTSKATTELNVVGLRYSSARCRGKCLVLFGGPELVMVDEPPSFGREPDPLLELLGTSQNKNPKKPGPRGS
jgi:hypothetical protein